MGRLMVVALLSLDREVDQLVMLAQKSAIGLTQLRFMSYDRNDRGEFSAADLPDMEIGHDRIAVALDRAANFVR